MFDSDLWRHKSGHGNKLKVGVSNQLPRRKVNALSAHSLHRMELSAHLASHRKGFSKL